MNDNKAETYISRPNWPKDKTPAGNYRFRPASQLTSVALHHSLYYRTPVHYFVEALSKESGKKCSIIKPGSTSSSLQQTVRYAWTQISYRIRRYSLGTRHWNCSTTWESSNCTWYRIQSRPCFATKCNKTVDNLKFDAGPETPTEN